MYPGQVVRTSSIASSQSAGQLGLEIAQLLRDSKYDVPRPSSCSGAAQRPRPISSKCRAAESKRYAERYARRRRRSSARQLRPADLATSTTDLLSVSWGWATCVRVAHKVGRDRALPQRSGPGAPKARLSTRGQGPGPGGRLRRPAGARAPGASAGAAPGRPQARRDGPDGLFLHRPSLRGQGGDVAVHSHRRGLRVRVGRAPSHPEDPSARWCSELARRVAQDLSKRRWRLEAVMSDNAQEFGSQEFQAAVPVGGQTDLHLEGQAPDERGGRGPADHPGGVLEAGLRSLPRPQVRGASARPLAVPRLLRMKVKSVWTSGPFLCTMWEVRVTPS